MKQPVEPNKEDCCNSGCNPCIFDVYEKQMKLYQKYLQSGEKHNITENAISQLEYTPFLLKESVAICESHKLLMFKKSNEDSKKLWWNPGDHFLIKYASEEVSCSRAYTPLKLKAHQGESDFSIIVKAYDNGLVSKYLNILNPGDHVLWRGPYGSYEVVHNKYNRIIMIAQGTGIVTFIEIIDKILDNEDDMTKIILYYCCQNQDIILLRKELHSFKAYWNFTYKIFLSHSSSDADYKYQEPIIHHRMGPEDLLALKPFSPNDQFLLCGSSDFMKAYDTLLRKESDKSLEIIMF